MLHNRHWAEVAPRKELLHVSRADLKSDRLRGKSKTQIDIVVLFQPRPRLRVDLGDLYLAPRTCTRPMHTYAFALFYAYAPIVYCIIITFQCMSPFLRPHAGSQTFVRNQRKKKEIMQIWAMYIINGRNLKNNNNRCPDPNKIKTMKIKEIRMT